MSNEQEKISDSADIFGAVSMGYLVIESSRLDDWRRFLKQGLGLHLESANDDQLAFRMDAHARRIVVRRGPAEDVVASGWQVRDRATLDILLRRFAERNIAVETGSDTEAAERGVKAFVRIRGPKNLPLELFTEAVTLDAPLNMLTSAFITGDAGMGHVAITTRLPEKTRRFWQEIFNARLSDTIEQPLAGMVLEIAFLRLNGRHHSVAIAATRGLRLDPIRTQIQHFNLLVATLDDLSGAFERLRDLGYEMAHEIGQHPNDKELSFYVRSPSGFEVELGWNALTVDESRWTPTSYNAISIWGHKPEKSGAVDHFAVNLGNARRGLRSLLSPEYSPL